MIAPLFWEKQMTAMTSAERQSLLGLIRQRERVAKTDAEEYGATLMADFEKKLAAVYYPSDHPAWKTAQAAAETAVNKAKADIAAACQELNIPKQFAPGIRLGWYERGENASEKRRAELRKVAETEMKARVKKAQAAIAKASVLTSERIITSALTSNAAIEMLASLPTPQQLLPELDVKAIERIANPIAIPSPHYID